MDTGDYRFRPPGVLGLKVDGRIYDPGMGPYPPRLALAPRTPTKLQCASQLGYHTVRSGLDLGNHRFCPRFVGVTSCKCMKGFCDPEMGPYPPWVALAHVGSGWNNPLPSQPRKRQQPLAWIWPMGIGIGQWDATFFIYFNCFLKKPETMLVLWPGTAWGLSAILSTRRPRLGATCDLVYFFWSLCRPASLPLAQGGAETLWIARPY